MSEGYTRECPIAHLKIAFFVGNDWKPLLSERAGSHMIKINQDLRSNQSKIKNHLLSESYGSRNRGRWSPNRNELYGQGAKAWKRKVGEEREIEIWSKTCM